MAMSVTRAGGVPSKPHARAADYCFLDPTHTSFARDALQNFALLSGRDDRTQGPSN